MVSRSRSSRHTLIVCALFLCVPFVIGQQQCFPPPDGNGGPVSPEIATIEMSAFNQVNQQRTANSRAALTMDAAMRTVARAHSQDMIDRGFTDHVNPDGLGPGQRLSAQGITYTIVGENIAWNQGYADPATAAVNGWMASSGHRANILDSRFTRTGMGVALATDGTYYFTQVFTAP